WLKERPGIPWEISWVVLLALALRVIAFWRFDPVAFDSAIYFEMADHVRAGHWSTVLTYDYPPLYPFLVAAVQWFLQNPELAGVFISLTADVCVIVPLFAIARTAVGYAGAWGAVFLWAIHPLAISLGVQALTDAPTAALVAVSIWAGLHALKHRRLAWAFAAGIASGLAHMTRPEGIEPALVLAALGWWPASKLGAPPSASPEIQSIGGSDTQTVPRSTLHNAAWIVAPLVGWAFVASPYIFAISEQAGTLTLSKKKSAAGFVRSLAGEGTSATPSQNPALIQPNGNAPDSLASSDPAAPQSRLNRLITGIYVFQKPLVNSIHPVVWILILIAAWNSRFLAMEGNRFARILLLTLVGLHFAVLIGLAADHGATYLGGHHFFLMVLYSLPFAGVGLVQALTWMTERARSLRWLPTVVLALLVAVPIVWLATKSVGRGVSVRPAAAWIRSQVSSGTPIVLTNITKVTYHAGAKRIELSGTYDQIIERARAQSAHYIVFYPDLIPTVSRDFLTRIDAAHLELVKVFPEPSRSNPNQRLEVYRLRQE
ncbi:MAG TPA: glycosyltransferase family 39 protein, partial [Terriglobia bacterium]|nr:glycosyltransferase family 39 protein [Terriglobia bacterium]